MHASTNRTTVHRCAEAHEALHLPARAARRGRYRRADLPGTHTDYRAALRPAARPALPRLHDLCVAYHGGARVLILLSPVLACGRYQEAADLQATHGSQLRLYGPDDGFHELPGHCLVLEP